MNIEHDWGLPDDVAFYRLHGQIGFNRYGLRNVQIVTLALLLAFWAFLLFSARRTSSPCEMRPTINSSRY